MCLGSLYYCSPKEVIFLITREDYEGYYLDDRKYFEVSNFYDEYAKDWDQRRLPMRYERRDAAVDVYRLWNERNGGQRKSTIVPPGSTHAVDSAVGASAIICVCMQVIAKRGCPTTRPVWWSRFSGCWPTPPACRCSGR